ncbi:MAG: hypothetical protein ACK4N4_14105 [Burkholderiales bacterium]
MPEFGELQPNGVVINPATEEITKMDNQVQVQEEPIPLMQKLLDNPFLLLFLGVMVPMVVYTLWGVVEILMVPLAK